MFAVILFLAVACSADNSRLATQTNRDVKISNVDKRVKNSGCDDYSIEEDADTNSVKIVSGGKALHSIKLLTDLERNGFAFNGVKKTKAGFELAVEYGSRIYYGKNFIFTCRQNKFYLTRIGVESFDKQNPEKWTRKVIRVRPNVPLEKFTITNFMLEGVVQH
jgi:hypothetical protein